MLRCVPLLLGVLLFTAGCCEFCNPDVHLGVSVVEPVFLGALTTVQLEVSFSESQPKVGCGLGAEGPDAAFRSPGSDLATWELGDVAKGESFRLPVTVTLTTPGRYTFSGFVGTGRGSFDSRSITVYLDEHRYVLNPTPEPRPVVVQASPASFPTSSPAPTGAGIR